MGKQSFRNGQCHTCSSLCTSQNEASTSPPLRAIPRAFEFLKMFFSNPLSRGQKAVQTPQHRSISGDQMPPPPGKLRSCCFNFSVASILLVKPCMKIKRGLIDNTKENQGPTCHKARRGKVTDNKRKPLTKLANFVVEFSI